MLATALPMFAFSLGLGWSDPAKLELWDEAGWLRTSQEEAMALAAAQPPATANRLPLGLGLGLWLAGLFLNFVIFR